MVYPHHTVVPPRRFAMCRWSSGMSSAKILRSFANDCVVLAMWRYDCGMCVGITATVDHILKHSFAGGVYFFHFNFLTSKTGGGMAVTDGGSDCYRAPPVHSHIGKYYMLLYVFILCGR